MTTFSPDLIARAVEMRKPRLLDAFCGAGGCSRGYVLAGFDVTGVDHVEQPNYLRSGALAFVQADALDFIREHGHEFDAIHASPPCQAYSSMNNRRRGRAVVKINSRLIADTFALLDTLGKPYVLENVMGAKAEFAGRHTVRLSGECFGLRVFRPRLFASNVLLLAPSLPRRQRDPVAVYGKSPDGRRLWDRADGTMHRACSSLEEGSAAMRITWMSWDEIREAIPPPYTEYLGKQLIRAIEVVDEA